MDTLLPILFAFFLAYWSPGWYILKYLSVSPVVSLVLAIPVGISLWGWQAWVFGWLHIQWVTYGYLLIFAVLNILRIIRIKKQKKDSLSQDTGIFADKFSLLLIVIGVMCQSLLLWNVFQMHNGHLTSCCGDTNDNTWYASITQSILSSFPPEYPGITGQILKNYHYWSNLVIADLVRVFHVDQFLAQFRYSGVLLSISLGLTILALSNQLRMNTLFTRWLLIFFYFGGDMIYAITLISNHTLGFAGSSLEDGVRFLSNPPRAYAVILSLTWLTLYAQFRPTLTTIRSVLLALILSSIVGFKVYLAFFIFTGLVILALYDATKKNKTTLVLLFLSLFFTLFVYLPVNAQAGGLYFVGFWRFQNFVSQPGFSLVHLDMARMVFEQDNKLFKAFLFDALFIVIYTVCIFGTKLLGLVPLSSKNTTFPVFFHILLLPSILVHYLIGALFQQSTGGSNTFNFHVNVFLFLSFYAALTMSKMHDLLKNRILLYGVFSFVVLSLTLPRAFHEVGEHIRRNADLYPITSPEVDEISNFLKQTPKNTLIAVHSNYIAADGNGPYMYLLTGRKQYLSAPPLIQQFGADTFDRQRNMAIIIRGGFPNGITKILKNEKIDYLIMDTGVAIQATKSAYWLTPIIQTTPLTLFKIELNKNPMPTQLLSL